MRTLEERFNNLICRRTDDILTGTRTDVAHRVQEARDSWLRERLSEQDFEEYRKRAYVGPAGDDFPRGWEDAELQAELALTEDAYRQGVRDGARLLSMIMGVQPFPGEGAR